jgi:tetratricopeptide (TPR) repeat protein
MAGKTLSDFFIDLTAALLKGFAVAQGADPTLAGLLEKSAAFTGSQLVDSLQQQSSHSPLAGQLLAANLAAQECFETGCLELELKAALSDLSPLGAQAVQQTIDDLRTGWDESRLYAALLAALQRDLPVLSAAQQLEAANLYLDCLRRALLGIPEIGPKIQAFATLRIDARTARIEAMVAEILARLESAADQSTHIEQNIGEVSPGAVVKGLEIQNVERLYLQQLPPTPRLMPPARPPRFHGREAELAEVLAGLEPGRVFSICGPGGMGKTALAAEALHALTDGRTPPADFPDGVFFHSFYNQPDIDFALQELASFFGEEPRPSPAAAARRALAGRCALLVLDGAEATGDLSLILDLRGCCGALITSRDRAQIYDRYLDLDPLPLESALKVLGDWAGAQAADEQAARRVCELLGRLPLALRLAGSYMASRRQAVSAYAAWLEPALQQGEHRQQSVLALFRRSLECLDPDMREVLGVASLLAFAPFDRALLAAALGYDDPRLLVALGELVRFSFLQPSDGAYQLVHVLLHSYASREVEPPPAALGNLAADFTRLAEEQSGLGPAGHAALDAVLAHMLAVLNALQTAAAWRPLIDLASSVEDYLDLHGRSSERLQVCRLALQASTAAGERWQEGAWLNRLGLTNGSLGRVTEAIDFYQQALAAFKAMDDPRNTGAVLGNLGNAYAALGEPRRAIDYHQLALEIDRQTGDRRGEGADLGNLGNAYAYLGEPRTAIDYYQQALEIQKAIGDRRSEGKQLGNLGNAYADLGEPRTAIDFYQQALEIARQTGDRRGEGADLGNLGSAYYSLGEPRQAIEYFQQALEIARQIGDRRGEGVDLGSLGIAHRQLGEPRTAIEYYQQALEIARQIGDRRGEGNRLGYLGNAYADLDEPRKAIEYYQQALEIARQTGDRLGEANRLNNLGYAYFTLGEHAQARLCYQQSLEITLAILPPEHPSVSSTQDNLAQLPPA